MTIISAIELRHAKSTKLNPMSKNNQKLSNPEHPSNFILKNYLSNQVLKNCMLALNLLSDYIK